MNRSTPTRLDDRGPFRVVVFDGPLAAINGGVVVTSLHVGDAFAAARDRGGFVVDNAGNIIEDRKRAR